MTKKYIAFKDKVLLTDKKYDGTTWSDYTSADVGKIAKVAETATGSGVYNLQLVDGTPSAPAWSDVTSKPFDAIGAGLTVVTDTSVTPNVQRLTADTQLHFEILDISTHPASASYKNTIALVAIAGTSPASYKEYACIKTSDTPETWAWEMLGGIEASVDQTDVDKILINGVEIRNASATQSGLLSKADYSTFNGKQDAISAKTKTQSVVAMSATAGSVAELEVKSDFTGLTSASTELVNAGGIVTALADKQNKIDASTTTDVPQAIVTTNTAGTVAKRDICTDVAPASVTTATTDLATAGAVKKYSARLDQTAGASTVDFAIGCDANGPYIDF